MPKSKHITWLVCYDITDQRRLQKVHKEIKQYGMPLQYSVFVIEATKGNIKKILNNISKKIDIRQDDLRAYPLMESNPVYIFGRNQLPPGVLLSGNSGISLVSNMKLSNV